MVPYLNIVCHVILHICLFVCTFVCMYVWCMYVCMHSSMHLHIMHYVMYVCNICPYTPCNTYYVCVCVCVCVRACVHACMRACVHVCVSVAYGWPNGYFARVFNFPPELDLDPPTDFQSYLGFWTCFYFAQPLTQNIALRNK